MNFTIIFIVSVAGTYYMYAGKKNAKFAMMISGAIMCALPYFVTDNKIMAGLIAALIAVPFLIKE